MSVTALGGLGMGWILLVREVVPECLHPTVFGIPLRGTWRRANFSTMASGAVSRALTSRWQGNHAVTGTYAVPSLGYCHCLVAPQQTAWGCGIHWVAGRLLDFGLISVQHQCSYGVINKAVATLFCRN